MMIKFRQLEKSTFLTSKLLFLGYIVSSKGIHVNDDKVQAIRDWPSPKTLAEVRSFHGLKTLFKRFVRNFSNVVALITICLKIGPFNWTNEVEENFKLINEKLTTARYFLSIILIKLLSQNVMLVGPEQGLFCTRGRCQV